MKIEIDKNRCIGCGQCAKRCRHNVLRIADDGKHRYARVVDENACRECLNCMKVCPKNAIAVDPRAKRRKRRKRIIVFLATVAVFIAAIFLS